MTLVATFELTTFTLGHHAANVRTTLTLDDDLAEQLRDLAQGRGTSFKQVLNDVLRRGLAAEAQRPSGEPSYAVEVHRGGLRPGIDPGKLNQLADQLDVEDVVEKAAR